MMKFLVLALVLGWASAGDRSASCTTDVSGYHLPPSADHYIVPVGWDFEATFTFNSDSVEWVIGKGEEHFAPGAVEDPELPDSLTDPSFQFKSIYTCEFQTGGAAGEYLHMEYGTAFPDSATCDTEFECCDISCEFVSSFQDPDTGDVNAPCGSEFAAEIQINSCPDAVVSVTEIGESGADIVNIGRDWEDGDRITVTYQCPEKRGSSHHVEVQVEDQYGGVDSCSMDWTCDWCLNTCNCPMCAPMDKTWVCYNDGDGDFNLVALTDEELESADGSSWIYPTEFYPGFEDDSGVQFDCWCDPICDVPPSGLTFVCHHDAARGEWHLAAVHTDDRPGPLNDLADYLAGGDGFPGTHIDGEFFDCWCDVIA